MNACVWWHWRLKQLDLVVDGSIFVFGIPSSIKSKLAARFRSLSTTSSANFVSRHKRIDFVRTPTYLTPAGKHQHQHTRLNPLLCFSRFSCFKRSGTSALFDLDPSTRGSESYTGHSKFHWVYSNWNSQSLLCQIQFIGDSFRFARNLFPRNRRISSYAAASPRLFYHFLWAFSFHQNFKLLFNYL